MCVHSQLFIVMIELTCNLCIIAPARKIEITFDPDLVLAPPSQPGPNQSGDGLERCFVFRRRGGGEK